MTLPIIMCVHRRPQFLRGTLEMLRVQTDQDFFLIIWDNSEGIWNVASYLEGSGLNVKVLGTGRNVGGIGRFYAARDLGGEHRFAIFLDDDQVFGNDLVSTFRLEARAGCLVGWWAWRIPGGDYFQRNRAGIGVEADYVGTGGMIAPLSLLRDPDLYRMLPDRFSRIEDLWLCRYFKGVYGGRLIRSKIKMGFTNQEKHPDQWRALANLKREFYRYLKSVDDAAGWPASLNVSMIPPDESCSSF
jgi:GT2 family glycosyltransferase